MITRRATLLGLLLTPLLGACGQLPSYRYRLTVEVDTPEGMKSGSSVLKVDNWISPRFPGPEAGGPQAKVTGEAVAVDLGPRGALFALLRSGDVDWALGVAPAVLLPPRRPGEGGDSAAWAERVRAVTRASGTREVPSDLYPMLVRFRDPADPMTVEKVDPANLAASFGPGVRLRRITIQITDDRVTRGIEERLPWLPALGGKYLSGLSSDGGEAPLGLHTGYFTQG